MKIRLQPVEEMPYFETQVIGVRMVLKAIEGNLLVEIGTVEAPQSGLRVSGITECKGDCLFIGDLSTGSMDAHNGEVLIEGSMSADGSIKVKGNLEVKGDMKADRVDIRRHADVGGSLEVHEICTGGSLTVKGTAKAHKIDVGGSLRCSSDAELDRIDVGGSAEIQGTTRSKRIDVGGKFYGYGQVTSDSIDVGGSFEVASEVNVEKLDVGGTATVGGGSISRKVDVGGVFNAKGPLKFGDIDVGGVVSLAGGTGEDIEVGGKLSSDGSLTFNRFRVGGTADVIGDAEGRSVRVGGSFRTSGRIRLSEELNVGGSVETLGSIEAETVMVGGSIRAESVIASRSIETNKLRTVRGAKADRIEISRRGSVVGPLIGREVVVQRDADVEEIWSDHVILLRGARARNVYAGILDAEEGSDISGSILFTGELHAERGCRFTAQPTKTEKLPDPPL